MKLGGAVPRKGATSIPSRIGFKTTTPHPTANAFCALAIDALQEFVSHGKRQRH